MYSFENIHEVQAAVVHCIDPRFYGIHLREMERVWVRDYDPYVWPGGPKKLLEEGSLNELIRVSVEMHHAHQIILIAHRDCGAYGGSKAFSSLEEERQTQEADLRKVGMMLLAKIPGLKVEMLYLEIVKPGKCEFQVVSDELPSQEKMAAS